MRAAKILIATASLFCGAFSSTGSQTALAQTAQAQTAPVPSRMGPQEFLTLAKMGTIVRLDDEDVFLTDKPFRMEAYSSFPPISALKPGWYLLRLRLATPVAPKGNEALALRMWSPANTPDNFTYNTSFGADELTAGETLTTLERKVRIGPSNGNYGFAFSGGWPELRLASLDFVPMPASVQLQSLRAGKLVFGTREKPTATVFLTNESGALQKVRLRVRLEGGLGESALILDQDIDVPVTKAGQAPFGVPVSLPICTEYGHQLLASVSQGKDVLGAARDYFYVSDQVERIGHLGAMGIGSAYTAEEAPEFVNRMRRMLFPLYEITFWAPDDALQLTSPKDREKWWSGQTLARNTAATIKTRVQLGHDQGMKVLSYANLRYTFGFRAYEILRQRPSWADWDASTDQGYSASEMAQQNRQDDGERFDEKGKARFGARGLWRLMPGNPKLVEHHIRELKGSMQEFGFDGFRYDDRYDYDHANVDILGRQMPYPGLSNAIIVGKVRSELQAAKPGAVYGHNMEWQTGVFTGAEEPSQLGIKPYPGDYYTEFLRDGGLHLQERYTAYMVGNKAPWATMADYLNRMGQNAYRFGGAAYAIASLANTRPVDGKHLTALYVAGMSHLAYSAPDSAQGFMRLACRYSELFYGAGLRPVENPAQTLQVKSARPLWWQPYVRYLEKKPGQRIYLVHLINPPVSEKIGEGDGSAPEAQTGVQLQWNLPQGWKATRAWQLAGEGAPGIESEVALSATGKPWARTTNDSVGNQLLEKELPLQNRGAAVGLTVPRVAIWTVVALECQGPVTDKAPPAVWPLPPAPSWPYAPGMTNPAPTPNARWTPGGLAPFVVNAANNRTGRMVAGKRQPMDVVKDGGATVGSAIVWDPAGTLEAYNGGVSGGTFRLSFRVKTRVQPPANAELKYSFWPAGRKWTVQDSLPLAGLPLGEWKTFTRDVKFGYDNGNFGSQLSGGWDGLLIDSFTIQELQRVSEREQMEARGLEGWPAGLSLTPRVNKRVWYGQGLYSEFSGLAEALKRRPNTVVDNCEMWYYNGTRGFSGPTWKSAQDLAGYDLVIMSNMDLKALTLEQRAWLGGYVRAGGALLWAGGPYAFGRGFWNESELMAPLFPIELKPYDIKADTQTLKAADNGLMAGLAFGGAPQVYWRHSAAPKADARVHLLAGTEPAMVTQQVGKGRVAALLVTPLGEEPAGSKPYWKWDGWAKVMDATLQYLLP